METDARLSWNRTMLPVWSIKLSRREYIANEAGGHPYRGDHPDRYCTWCTTQRLNISDAQVLSQLSFE